MNPQSEIEHRKRIMEMLRGYRQSRVLVACSELQVFETLAGGPRTARELAEQMGTSVRGLELLLNAAVALGLLEKRDNLYMNSPMAASCLAEDGTYYLGHFIRREGAFYDRWGRLTQTVRTGLRPEENRHDEDAANWVREFELGLYDLARATAPVVADALALPEDRPVTVLDVGGGHGGYSLALARRYPLLTATVFELPRVIPVTREIIARAGLADRVQAQEGDFSKDDLGRDYDVALAFGVLNGQPPEGRAALIRKVYSALGPGGRIVFRESLINPDRAGPVEPALFAVQMLLATENGGVSTQGELAGWLLDAGFGPPQTIALPAWIGSQLTIAFKP